MKKILSLFIALFVMSFCAKAQVTFLNEGFEGSTVPAGWTTIDADNDGYNWVSSTTIGTFNVHSGDACITSSSYVNGVGALTPDNWLITPQLAVSAGDSISFWYRGQDATDYAEVFGVYVSTTGTATSDFTSVYQGVATNDYQRLAISLNAYAGQNIYVAIRHWNVTNMFWLNIDDVQFGSLPSTPTIVALADTIALGMSAIGSHADYQMTLTGYSLTNDITVTTAAPFSVSADGVTFGTTATMTASTGTGNITTAPLYVRYTPTAIGTDNGSMTVASTGVTSSTVVLTGTGIDCTVSTYPYNFSFDQAGLLNCWNVIDANEDGSTFTVDLDEGYAYYTYNASNAADDYLISPEFVLTGNGIASFDYWCASSYFPETFVVYAFGATDTVLLVNTVDVSNTSTAPLTQYLDLSSLNGNYRIAIKCTSLADQFRLYIDNFSISSDAVASITANPTSIDFGKNPTGNSETAAVELTIVAASDDITVATAAPYAVSLDGTNFASTVTIPAGASVLYQTIYVQFTPATAGIFSGSVTVSTTGASATITLAGEGIECSVITNFPFVEDFEPSSDTRDCWIIEDANYDGTTITIMPYDEVENLGVAAYFYSATSSANDWLISPEMTLPADAHVGYHYACAGSYSEKYSVWIIPQGGSTASAVNVLPTQTINNSALAIQSIDLSAYAGQTVRIAFKVESDPDKLYIFFDNITVTQGVGINDVENNISIYPNPASSVLNVNANSNIQSVEVMNLMGQTIQIEMVNGLNTQINTSSLSNGVYMLRVNTENGVVNQKFTVAR